MSITLQWHEQPHQTIWSAPCGDCSYPRIAIVATDADYEARIIRGELGFALEVCTEPQQPPSPDGMRYGRMCLVGERWESLELAQRRAAALIEAHRKGCLIFSMDDSGNPRQRIVAPMQGDGRS